MFKPTHFKKKAIAIAITLATVPVHIVHAEEELEAKKELDTVTVTATRRAESIQDIPINMSAVTGENIEEQGIGDLTELAQWIPGLTVVDQGARGSNQLIVRGLSTKSLGGSEGNGNNNDATVATYLGDVPLFIDLKLNDIERVEALLGPQGTLYGAGALAGAIRYLPNKPRLDETTLQIRGDLSSISESDDLSKDVGFTLNKPLTDKLAFRANVDYLDEAGFIDNNFIVREAGVSDPEPDFSNPTEVADNLRSVEDANYEKALSARLALFWQINDKIDATFSYNLQDQDIGGRQINHNESFGTGNYESANRYLEYNDRKNELYALEVNADVGFADLTWSSGYSEFHETGQRDQTDLLLDILPSYGDFPTFSAFTLEETEEERISQEIRLVSNTESDLSWIAGVFYNSYESDEISTEFTPGLPGFFGVDSEVYVDPFDPNSALVATDVPVEYIAGGPEDLEEIAVYGEIGYRITDPWQVTVGSRWYEYELTSGGYTQFPLYPSINSPYSENTVTDSGMLYKFNTSYDFTDDVMAYFTVSEGYRIGGVNRFPICTAEQIAAGNSGGSQVGCIYDSQQLIKPDTTTNYELGLRTSLFDHRLSLNGSIYRIVWEDVQVPGFTPFSSENITVNGGEAESTGIELSFQALVTDALRLRGSFSYNDAKLTKDAPGLVAGEDAFSGDRLTGSPEKQGSLFATYSMFFDDFFLDLNYGISYTGGILSRIGKRGNGEELDSFTLHNFSAVFSKNMWKTTFYVNNVFDEYYETGVRSTRDAIGTSSNANNFTERRYFKNVGTPRTIGVAVSYDFDL